MAAACSPRRSSRWPASSCSRCASRSRSPRPTALPGFLFAALTSFDQPFNQAPSLHIALLVILWVLYARHRAALGAVAAAPLVRAGRRLGAHHLSASFLRYSDRRAARVPLPVAVAGSRREPAGAAFALTRERRRLVLAVRYAAGALSLIAALALWIGGAGLAGCSGPRCRSRWWRRTTRSSAPHGFQKDADGRMSLAARVLLAPYLVGAWHQLARLDAHGSGAGRGRATAFRSAAFPTRDVAAVLRPSSTSAPSCRVTARRRSPGAPSRCSISSRLNRRVLARGRRGHRAGAHARARCWSAARSAIRAAPPPSRPGCSRMVMRSACRRRSSAIRRARPRIVLRDDARGGDRARGRSAHMTRADRDVLAGTAALLDQGRTDRPALARR